MKKYIEFGIGNRWLLRTEIEHEDGTESERRGILWPQKVESLYLRIWLGKTVLIADTKEGFKRSRKQRRSFKMLFGIMGV